MTSLRIALVGCGQIADAHLQEIAKISGAQVVGVCDRHADLAMQAALRFNVERYYHNMEQMLRETAPEVVHLATPAHTHGPLAIQLLESGCHVYVEKPFTVDVEECREVLDTARQRQRLVCVGHDQLFDPMWLRAREMVDSGRIGSVRHVESVLGYPIGGQFGAQVTADPRHWVRQLPGGLFHNTLSHPLYRILDLLPDDKPHIDAHWFRRGRFDFPTDLRLHLRGEAVTGSVLFDSSIAPQRMTRIYGERGCLTVDFDVQVIRLEAPPRMPGAFGKLEGPWRQWREAGRNAWRNLRRFARCDIHYFAGMQELFRRFYDAVGTNSAPPIAYAEIKRVTGIMDETFSQCREREGVHGNERAEESPRVLSRGSHALQTASRN